MKTNAKSVQVYQVMLWSPSYYGKETNNKHVIRIYDGQITDVKTKKNIHFHSAAEFLSAVEKMFLKAEQKK